MIILLTIQDLVPYMFNACEQILRDDANKEE